jgi:hypothetical protein
MRVFSVILLSNYFCKNQIHDKVQLYNSISFSVNM